ncbi:mandelate racemase/muconate lactonizing enzyme family protein [Salibacterium aidingense]|uniref:mandelate racemase/muconate lactonizing enzyme family protein n=1 Tax=Salibacterium aidingense TaxID=384933 RepID=UPI003BD5540E
MKISNVDVLHIEGSNDYWIWLRMKTDGGMEGWGEVTGSGDDKVLATIVQTLSTKLVGRDALNLDGCIEACSQTSFPNNTSNRFISTAISGIDQCLWDIRAQYFNIPLYWLLGGYEKCEIPLYANLNRGLLTDRSPEALEKNGLKAVENGFSFVKCTPFDEVTPGGNSISVQPGLSRLANLVSKVGMEKIAIDCHQRFNRVQAYQFLEYLKDFDTPFWVEDLLFEGTLRDQKMVYTDFPSIRWAGGETACNIKDILLLIQNGFLDVIMPDVKHCGGVSALKTIIPLIESSGTKVSLHNPSGPIATAFSAHLLSLSSNPEPLEYPWGSVPERKERMQPFEPVSNGIYYLSDLPGIGIKPREEFLESHAHVWEEGMWRKWKSKITE